MNSDLPYRTCLELLKSASTGRVAMCTPTGPQIVPINYTVVDDCSLVFRTTPYSDLGTHGWNTRLAFEVDHQDPETRRAWSVVAVGRGQLVEDSDELEVIRTFHDPQPWAGGVRMLYLRLVWDDLTGRQIGAWTPGDTPLHPAR